MTQPRTFFERVAMANQMMAVTGTEDRTLAMDILNQHGWNLQSSVLVYTQIFNDGQRHVTSAGVPLISVDHSSAGDGVIEIQESDDDQGDDASDFGPEDGFGAAFPEPIVGLQGERGFLIPVDDGHAPTDSESDDEDNPSVITNWENGGDAPSEILGDEEPLVKSHHSFNLRAAEARTPRMQIRPAGGSGINVCTTIPHSGSFREFAQPDFYVPGTPSTTHPADLLSTGRASPSKALRLLGESRARRGQTTVFGAAHASDNDTTRVAMKALHALETSMRKLRPDADVILPASQHPHTKCYRHPCI